MLNKISPLSNSSFKTRVPVHRVDTNATFERLLQDKILKFSNHAEVRLKQRGIILSDEILAKIDQALDKVADKGGKEALILVTDMALIASVKNKTIVTAIDKSSMEDRIFTQIDSAVIIS